MPDLKRFVTIDDLHSDGLTYLDKTVAPVSSFRLSGQYVSVSCSSSWCGGGEAVVLVTGLVLVDSARL